jgi:hypothetical protein
LGAGRRLRGQNHGEGGKTENGENSAHKASSYQSTRNSTLFDPAQRKKVPALDDLTEEYAKHLQKSSASLPHPNGTARIPG